MRGVILILLLFCGSVRANPYDSLFSDSTWYVPAFNLQAYLASGTNFTQTVPVADQTLWVLGPCTNGIFTGTSQATLRIGPATNQSVTTIHGLVTDSGQVRMNFSNPNSVTIGIGQMRNISGTNFAEMQMITPVGASYLTHWAYMAVYESGVTVLPPLDYPPPAATTPYSWLAGTAWNLSVPDLFSAPATFDITDYDGGYFWGDGTSGSDVFTLIGSTTPEGNLLFNILLSNNLTSLTGQLLGGATNGTMLMRTYEQPDGFGIGGSASIVPEPAPLTLISLGALSLIAWTAFQKRLRFPKSASVKRG